MFFFSRTEQFRYFAQNMISRIDHETLVRAGANVFLLGATVFAALGFFEDGYPSESEQAKIYACADHLGLEPRKAYEVPEDCTAYTDEFVELQDDFADYMLPTRNAFLDETVWTSHIEEERKEDFDQSLVFLSLSLSFYGVSAFSKRLNNPDPSIVGEQAEEWLQSQPRQQ
jgi:hypothetical protein